MSKTSYPRYQQSIPFLSLQSDAFLGFLDHINTYKIQGEEMERLISELARIVGGEKALVEECGLLLSNTYTSQVCFANTYYFLCFLRALIFSTSQIHFVRY